MSDVLRPSAASALEAWAARVRANREQVDQFREATPGDFYAPVAGMFRADPRRHDEPLLERLLALVQPDDVVLDIGAGGGRYALPLALASREVIAVEPSDGMRQVLAASTAEFGIHNVQAVDARWPLGQAGSRADPAGDSMDLAGDVALISHLGYDVEDIGSFLDAMEAAARRLCVAVLLSQPPPSEADRFWPLVHGVVRAALPSLPEFLTLLLARGRLFEVQLVDRSPQSFAAPEQALTALRQQLWTAPGSAKDQRLEAAARDRLQERDGRYALAWEPVPVGIVTWRGPA